MTKLDLETKSQAKVAEGIRVVVTDDGPYLLYGMPPFTQQFITPDKIGESWTYTTGEHYKVSEVVGEPTALCRCGRSHNAPYCDGSHTKVDWVRELTAEVDRILDDARYFEGDEMILSDNERYCCYARFCHPAGSVWRLTEESADPESRDLAIREASMCPSARLMAWQRGESSPYEFDFQPSVAILEDPVAECSAGLWLRGRIAVEKESGERYEIRNRVVLCRCGESGNKPYCDGSHASAKWHDGLREFAQGEEFPQEPLEVKW